MRRGTSSGLALALLFILVSTARPAIEAGRVGDLRVQPGVAIAWEELDATDQSLAGGRLEDFEQRTGTRWTALDYAPGALTPRLALGTGLDLGRPVIDAAGAELLARELVESHPDLFATESDRLAVWRTYAGAGKWAVHFWEVVGGYPVLGTKVTTVFTADGVLAGFGASTYPMITAAAAPVLTERDAFERAHAHLRQLGAIAADPASVRWRVEGPYVLPVVVPGGTPEPGTAGITGRTILRVTLSSNDPVAAWEVDVDAVGGEVLQRMNGIYHADFTGTVSVDVEDPGYCAGSGVQVLPEVEVQIDGVGGAVTAEDGSFLVPYAGDDARNLELTLRGPWVAVSNVDGPSSFLQELVTPGVPADILVDGDHARFDERDVFFHTNRTHAMLKAVDPGWNDLDFVMPARVNIDAGCNAFYSFADSSINFYRERNGCGNTGQIGDVVAHEYGHAITRELYGPNQPSGDLHEGNSDIVANLLFGYSLIGPGFYLDDCDRGIRDSDNDLRWPEDLRPGSGHYNGQIIAGFYWNALQYLIASDGEAEAFAAVRSAWYFGRLLGLPANQPEQAWWSILADDDNGNVDDGTPHFAALCQAAQDKGFECPETFTDVVIKHAPILYAAKIEGDHRIEAEIYSLVGALAADSVNLYWRPSGPGSFTAAPFAPTGEGNVQEAFIPEQPLLGSVDYFLVAEDEFGNRLRRPAGSGHYQFEIVTAYDNGELGSPGWSVGDPEDDATTGVWELVDPNEMRVGNDVAQPGDDASPDPGAFAWITQQFEGGSPILSDVTGTTTLFSPVYDVSGSAWVHIQLARWFQTLFDALGTLEVSVTHDAGASWTLLRRLDVDDAAASWEIFTSIVPEPLGGFGNVQFKFVAFGGPNPSVDECAIDEFILLASDTGSPSSVDEEQAASLAPTLRVVTSNPTRGLAGLEYSLPSEGLAQISVYGVDGRRVRSLIRGMVPGGTHSVTWDGRDDLGNAVGSGVYFVRLASPHGADVRRIVLGR